MLVYECFVEMGSRFPNIIGTGKLTWQGEFTNTEAAIAAGKERLLLNNENWVGRATVRIPMNPKKPLSRHTDLFIIWIDEETGKARHRCL